MKQSFKSAVIEKFDDIELDENQLAQLTGLESANNSSDWASLAQKIAVCFTLVCVLIGANYFYQSYSANNLLNSIANEAIDNHLKSRPLEIESQNLPAVLAYFTELDFNLLRVPDLASGPEQQLLGGRYCSINGITAAQFRVRNSEGNVSSWYQGILPDNLLHLIPESVNPQASEPSIHNSKGVKAEIWRYQGVVFVKVTSHS